MEKPSGRLNKAQAVTELAIFGAILIFVMGTILRTGLSSNLTQNHALKAMRLALLESYKTSRGDYSTGISTARNSASVLLLEDRLSPDFNKYGGIDRTPLIIQARGTFSQNIFFPVDLGDIPENEPLMDVFVNGQHFILTTARFVAHDIVAKLNPGGNPMPTPPATKTFGYLDASDRNLWVIQNPIKLHEWNRKCVVGEDKNDNDILDAGEDLDSDGVIDGGYKCSINGGNDDPPPCPFVFPPANNIPNYCKLKRQQVFGGPAPQKRILDLDCGCARFYVIVANNKQPSTFCMPNSCPLDPNQICPDSALYVDETFDLNRNNLFSDDPQEDCATAEKELWGLAWQWKAIDAVAGNVKIDTENGNYPTFDVDGDGFEETIYWVETGIGGVITRVGVIDQQEGDMDATRGDTASGPDPGIQDDAHIYSFLKDKASGASGTYLQILEGKLYNPENGQFVRSVSRKDQVDLVERFFILSNDTDRFCDRNNNRVPWVNGRRNPVEACGNCFSSANINKTCFDQSAKKLFMRSRILDRRGRKWITDTTPP